MDEKSKHAIQISKVSGSKDFQMRPWAWQQRAGCFRAFAVSRDWKTHLLQSGDENPFKFDSCPNCRVWTPAVCSPKLRPKPVLGCVQLSPWTFDLFILSWILLEFLLSSSFFLPVFHGFLSFHDLHLHLHFDKIVCTPVKLVGRAACDLWCRDSYWLDAWFSC